MYAEPSESAASGWVPGNKGRLVGPKPPFKLKHIWAVCIRLQIANRARQLALLNLAAGPKSFTRKVPPGNPIRSIAPSSIPGNGSPTSRSASLMLDEPLLMVRMRLGCRFPSAEVIRSQP